MRSITSGDFTADSVRADRRAGRRRSRAARSRRAPRARVRPTPGRSERRAVAALVLLAAAAPAVVVAAQHGAWTETVVTSRGRPTPARCGRSVPIVVSRPWPGSTSRSAGRVKSRRSIDSMICSKSPPGQLACCPAPPGNRVSPLNRIGWPSSRNDVEPGGVAGVVDGAQAEVADRDHLVVGDHEVVGREHRRRRRRAMPTSMPALRSASTAWMWSQWPWVVSTRRTPVALLTSSRSSCSLAASMITASPVPLQRTTNTLFSNGPTMSLSMRTVGRLVVGGARHGSKVTAGASDRPGRRRRRPGRSPVASVR